MTDLSVALILKTLDGLSLRAAATAENLANASTPGFSPRRVRFEEALRAAAAEGPAAVDRLVPTVTAPQVASGGGDVLRVDLEMASASLTAQRYGALVDLLSRQLQLTAIAIKGSL